MTDGVIQKSKRLRGRNVRPLLAYWILGICNNYGYVVMLSAAKDILHDHKEAENTSETFFNATKLISGNADRKCNYMSTGAILLADILPSLLIKFVAPFLPFFVNVRVAFCIILAQVGFVVVAFSTFQWMAILGVIFTSLSAGLGEATFLQYSSYYGKNTVSTWSSGTGAAGVVGASSYIVLHKLGLQNALLLMCVIPLLMAFAFWAMLPRPELKVAATVDTKAKPSENAQEEKNVGSSKLSLKEKVSLVPGLFKYMLPLGMVYFLEYFINQGMFELVNFEGIFLDKDEQYRWLQMDYQLGVFISRSSVNLIHIDNIWLMTVFQLLNVIYFTFEALYYLTPSIWIVFAITLWEGTLGGAAYVNTFYKIITKEVDEGEKQFSMGATSFADSIGIALAGVSSILVHNRICDMAKPERVSF